MQRSREELLGLVLREAGRVDWMACSLIASLEKASSSPSVVDVLAETLTLARDRRLGSWRDKCSRLRSASQGCVLSADVAAWWESVEPLQQLRNRLVHDPWVNMDSAFAVADDPDRWWLILTQAMDDSPSGQPYEVTPDRLRDLLRRYQQAHSQAATLLYRLQQAGQSSR